MVTSRQKVLVQESFTSLAPALDDVMVLFYGRLFEIDPVVRQMFPHDMTAQRRKLAQMLGAAVKGLDRLDQLVPVLEDLGRRHARYGVMEQQYDTVGAALLWTLEKGLGSGFTPELQDAWAAVYGVVATVMKNAARTAVAAA
jgi:hemoglobin-like flavoprotein